MCSLLWRDGSEEKADLADNLEEPTARPFRIQVVLEFVDVVGEKVTRAIQADPVRSGVQRRERFGQPWRRGDHDQGLFTVVAQHRSPEDEGILGHGGSESELREPERMRQALSDSVVIRFTEVTNWTDPETGEVILSNQHSLEAKVVQQDANETIVIDGQGDLVGSWPTEVVDRISWVRRCGDEPRPVDELPRAGTKEWLEQVKRAHPNAYQPWTEAEDEQLREESGSGMTVREIAGEHQRRPSAIASRLKKLGITPS